jgi:hypothetical protein
MKERKACLEINKSNPVLVVLTTLPLPILFHFTSLLLLSLSNTPSLSADSPCCNIGELKRVHLEACSSMFGVIHEAVVLASAPSEYLISNLRMAEGNKAVTIL